MTVIRDVPPPRTPAYLLPRWDEDEEFVTIIRNPPPPPVMAGVLPIPMPIPVPVRARPPRYFYQPIAPRTPRGPVAIPVAAPPVFGALMGDEGPRPRRGLRPEQPRVPRQPGLAAPVEAIPITVNPRALRDDRGIRPGEPPRPRASLPSRPIPFPQAGQPAHVRPGERPDRDRGPRPDRPDPRPRRGPPHRAGARCGQRPGIRGSMPARSCRGSRGLKAHGSRSSASVQVAAMSVAIRASGPSRRLP